MTHSIATQKQLSAPGRFRPLSQRLMLMGSLLAGSPLLHAQAPSDTMTKVYTYDGGIMTVDYKRIDLRGPHFDMYSHDSTIGYVAHTPVHSVGSNRIFHPRK